MKFNPLDQIELIERSIGEDVLSKVLPKEEKKKVFGKARLEEIPVDLIEAPPLADRIYVDEAKIEELARNISQVGLIHPIVVRPLPDGKYQRVVGRRRLLAVQKLGWKTIPAYVLDISEDLALAILLAENAFREDLSDIEKVSAQVRYLSLMFGVDRNELKSKLIKLENYFKRYGSKAFDRMPPDEASFFRRLKDVVENTFGSTVRTFLAKTRALDAPEYVIEAAAKAGWGYATVEIFSSLIKGGYEKEAKELLEEALEKKYGHRKIRERADEIRNLRTSDILEVEQAVRKVSSRNMIKKIASLPEDKRSRALELIRELLALAGQ